MSNDPMDLADRFLLGMAQTALSASLLALVVWLVDKALPQLPHTLRAVLWWLVCARFVVGIVCAALLPPTPALLVAVPPFWQARGPAGGAAENAARLSPADFAPANPLPAKSEPPAGLPDVSTKASATLEPSMPFSTPTVPQVLCAVWLLGFAVRLIISGAQYARLRRRLRASQLLTGDETDPTAQTLLLAAADAAQRLRRTPAPRLLFSHEPGDPLVTGWRRPAILLGRADVARLSPDELRLVLCHEIAHIARRDLFWGIVPHLVLHLFWFWPVAYWACREWSLTCEADCDQRAAFATNTAPRVYGELLLKLGINAPGAPFAALPVSVHFHSLRRRLVMLDKTPPVSRKRRLVGALGASALALAAVPLALLPLRFAAVASASDTAPYTRINRETGKAWSTYPDTPRNLTFADGLANWQVATKEGKSNGYTIALQNVKAPSNGPSLLFTRLKTEPKNENVRGVVVQNTRPGAFRGKRIRFSGWIKTEGSDGAGLFLRLDAPNWQKAWNQVADPLTGANDWQKVSYVFDVPRDAQGFSFGAHLSGAGKVWLHDLTFEIVGDTVAATPAYFDSSPEGERTNGDTGKLWVNYPAAPTNLNFARGVENWQQGESDKTNGYVVGAQTVPAPTPGASGVLSAKASLVDEFGILAQYARPGALKGKRVRFSAWVKTEAVKNGAGVWLRMDTPNWQKAWNMTAAPITGTTNWMKREYVFDVPADASGFAFGTDLTGKGKIWLHDVSFTPVGASTPLSLPAFDLSPAAKSAEKSQTSDGVNFAAYPENPTNLTFKDGLAHWWNDNPEHNAEAFYAIRTVKFAGRNSGASNPDRTAALLESTSAHPKSYGTLAQNSQAENLRGKRIRYSVWLKTEKAQAAGFWIVIHTGENTTGYNRRMVSPIQGTTEWKKYAVEIDVPQNATGISYGLSLDGTGKVWTDEIDFAVIGDSNSPQTADTRNAISGVNWSAQPTRPMNLDFADGLTDWQKATLNSAASDYTFGTDVTAARNGGSKAPAFIRTKSSVLYNSGLLMQGFRATAYQNKRVRFSGYIKTEAAKGALIYIRMDTPHKISAWNMGKHFLQGTNNWTRVEYVFDVPADAEGFNYGASLAGPGTVWADGFQFEFVGRDVPVTPEPGG